MVSSDAVQFQFTYPDREPIDGRAYPWPGKEDIRVCVGVHSRRVWLLLFPNSAEYLAGDAPHLPIVNSVPWAQPLGDRADRSASRNAFVIYHIIRALPDSLRAAIMSAVAAAYRAQRHHR
jgi:hypothetical protein